MKKQFEKIYADGKAKAELDEKLDDGGLVGGDGGGKDVTDDLL